MRSRLFTNFGESVRGGDDELSGGGGGGTIFGDSSDGIVARPGEEGELGAATVHGGDNTISGYTEDDTLIGNAGGAFQTGVIL